MIIDTNMLDTHCDTAGETDRPGRAMTRSYDMTTRSRGMEATREGIVAAVERLLADGPVEGVTLPAIAEGAGVSVRTVLRHFGTRDRCIEAVHHRIASRIDAQRGQVEPGDQEGAIDALLAHYEAEGRLVLNLLAQERVDPYASRAVETGRSYHRNWIERCFGPLLGGGEPDPRTIDALVAATDLYLWKLLRLDLGRSPAEVRETLLRLVRGVHSGVDPGEGCRPARSHRSGPAGRPVDPLEDR